MRKHGKLLLSIVLSGILICSTVSAEISASGWKIGKSKIVDDGGNVAGINNNDQILVQYNTGFPCIINDGSKTSIDGLGGTNVHVRSINDKGQVVGSSNFADGKISLDAFLWEDGKSIDLGRLGGLYSEAYDINNLGQIVGFTDVSGGKRTACLWDNGKIIPLGTLDGESSVAVAINDKGQIIGNISYSDKTTCAFLWENGIMKKLEMPDGCKSSNACDINNKGEIVGNGRNHAVLWNDREIQDLGQGSEISGESASAVSINDSGFICGKVVINSKVNDAAIWYKNKMISSMESFCPCFINNKNHLAGNQYVVYEYTHPTMCELVEDLSGDVTCDGKINSKDVSVLKKALLNGSTDGLNNADLNGDGKINSTDYSLLKRKVLKEDVNIKG